MRPVFHLLLWLIVLLPATAHAFEECNFDFELDTQSSAHLALGQAAKFRGGLWRPIAEAPDDIKSLSRFVGRLTACLRTPDGKARTIMFNGVSRRVTSPFMAHCTATLLSNNRLLTNHHCYFDPRFVDAGFTVVDQARISFGYTSADFRDTVRTFPVNTQPLALDRKTDALLLKISSGNANEARDGHFPMVMENRTTARRALTMIHHPGAGPLQFSSGTCQIHPKQSELPVGATNLRHACESTGGSSGALLLDARSLAVVGLHNLGGLGSLMETVNGQQVAVAVIGHNGGHRMEAVDKALGLGFKTAALSGKAPPANAPPRIPDSPAKDGRRDEAPPQTGEALVRALQTELNRHACNAGKVDGSFGPASVRALLLYSRMRPTACDPIAVLEKIRREPTDAQFVTDGNAALKTLQACSAPACGAQPPAGYGREFKNGCFFKTSSTLAPGEYAEWSGACDAAGYATGQGRMNWVYPEGAKSYFMQTYVGSMCRGLRCEEGTITFLNGRTSQGMRVDGLLHGRGRVEYRNGVYEGAFRNGKRNGFGEYTWSNADYLGRYVGEYRDGRRHGQGRLFYRNGDEYDGGFFKGQRHGQGKLTFANGDSWTGPFAEDALHGWGLFRWKDGRSVRALYQKNEYIRNAD